MNRILVIEDEDSVRENILDLLTAEGYFPIPARDGEEGVRLAWEEKPELIVCDIVLPQLDGYGVFAKLSRDPQTSTIPFIFLTALSSPDEIRGGMSLGADDFITKPFELQDLLKSIEIRLDKKNSIALRTQQIHADRIGILNNRLPFDILGPLELIKKQSETLVMKSELMNRVDIKNLASRILKSSEQVIRIAQDYLFLTNVEGILREPDRMFEHQRAMTRRGDEVAGEMIRSVLATCPKLSLEPADLQISYDHLLRLVEETLEMVISTPGREDAIQILGEKSSDGKDFHLQFIFPNQVEVGRVSSLPESQLIRYNHLTGEMHHELGFLIIERLLELYRGDQFIESGAEGMAKITLVIPLANDNEPLV